jgi:hypothetical protein
MRTPGLSTFLAISSAGVPGALYGQFTDPRTYSNTPVGLDQLELDYAYAHADASIDTSIVVGGAQLDLNQGAVAYTHTFGILQRMTWVKATVPFASVGGSVTGTGISGSVAGAGDASLEIAALLKGGAALSVADFSSYQPTTTVGVSLTATGPTGKYDPARLLNLGSNRWSFKPQIAVAHPFGPEQRWEVDGYVNAYFFTDNTTYRGREVLRQEPLLGFEGHISYNFTSELWSSLDASYSFRGTTVIDNVDQHDAQRNLTVGTETSWSPNPRNSIALVLAKSMVHENGPAYTGVAIKYFHSWGAVD